MEALKLDQQGSRGLAVSKYQRAVEILLKLSQLYPEIPQRHVYLQRALEYQERIKTLQGGILRGEPIEQPREEIDFKDLFLRERSNVKWSDVADLEDAKRAVRESILYPVKRPDLFPLGWPTGILIFGPPGCGKTLLAAAVSAEIEADFIAVDAASIMSKWLGEAEKNVASLFKMARQTAEGGRPVIIFIDEIDSLLGIRGEEVGGEVRVRNQFLKEMDGVMNKSREFYVYVIGATNKPWSLDEPFIRRFQKRIYTPPPDYHARLEMFKSIYTRGLKLSPDVDFDELAKETEGYTGSDIRDICQSAQLKVVRELFESGNAESKLAQPREITMQDFYEVIKDRKPTVTYEMLKLYERWRQAFKAS